MVLVKFFEICTSFNPNLYNLYVEVEKVLFTLFCFI